MPIFTDPTLALQSVLPCAGGKFPGVLIEPTTNGIMLIATNGTAFAMARIQRSQTIDVTGPVWLTIDMVKECLEAEAFRIRDDAVRCRVNGATAKCAYPKTPTLPWRNALPKSFHPTTPQCHYDAKMLARCLKWAANSPYDLVRVKHPAVNAVACMVRGEDNWLLVLQNDDNSPSWITEERLAIVNANFGTHFIVKNIP